MPQREQNSEHLLQSPWKQKQKHILCWNLSLVLVAVCLSFPAWVHTNTVNLTTTTQLTHLRQEGII